MEYKIASGHSLTNPNRINYTNGINSTAIFDIIIIIAIITILVIFLWLTIQTIRKRIRIKYANLVFQYSSRYKAITNLNSLYLFNVLEKKYNYRWFVNSKQKYDRFDFRKQFKETVRENPSYFLTISEKAAYNNDLYKKYKNEVIKLPDFSEKNGSRLKYNFKRFSKYEHKICDNELLHPVINPIFECTVRYTSPAGRNSYCNFRSFSSDMIYSLIDEIQKDNKRKDSTAYQRSLMTPTLRYNILKRDGFKCLLCGRSAEDGIKLHVDHIIPVSKGGKTIYSNLRTLCNECNQGKSDKYDSSGVV
ncbi:HNH endonuclease [Butyrivibrio fibrisolvens]|uniref:HNH nuclease domain-containing protein n=1 Tax=Butyrivibrio fibrisolvens TaxID=831 RepID=A0A317G7W4_BUTFI|nr:HNH endonuclease signature motif containing protein [Butyrivibrio fibrisolvens]PWT28412.1 hypothetical protein CPT75_15445 [Butyrivibrio fibrisolvens]